MNGNWQYLGDVCEKIVDCPHSTPKWTDHGFIVLRNQNIRNGRLDLSSPSYTDAKHYKHRINRAKPVAGDIIFTREAPMGEVCIIPDGLQCCVGQRQVLLRPAKTINSKYLLYAMQSSYVRNQVLWNEGTGSVVSNVRIPVLKKLKIPRFDAEHEQYLVNTLSSLDDKIELNQRMNNTLEGIAQALFKSWFVDFDPVKAKAEGRKPEGMDDATATLFPSRFIDSPLGLIPEGWKSSSIGECFKLIMGQSPPGETYNEIKEGIAFYQGRTDFGWRFPMERIYCNAPTRFAERNDTLVSVRAPVGDVNMALDRCCIGRGVAALRHNSDASSFTYYTAQQLQAHFKNFDSEGTVFGSINKADFAKLPHIEPKDKVIQLYETIASSLDKRIKTNEDQIRNLTEVRDHLLPRLISGKLRVEEVSETVEALAL